MSILKIHRTLKTYPQKQSSAFETTVSLCGIPLIKSSRTGKKVISILGIPVYKKTLRPHSQLDDISHFLAIGTDPYNVPKAAGVMRLLQLSSFELLKKVAQVCEKHHLTYWLSYGTLLGAVRHKGFIPWDDDVDIAMPRTDWEKFHNLLDEEFGHGNFCYNGLGFIQIHYKGTPMQVDIFPYDNAPEVWFPEGEKEAEFVNRIYEASAQLTWDLRLNQEVKDSIKSHNYEERKALHQKMIMQGKEPHPKGNLFQGFESFTPPPKRYTVLHEWIFPLQELEFEGMKFPCPRLPEIMLFSHYGEYGSLPSNPYHHFNVKSLDKKTLLTLLRVSQNGILDE